MGLPSPRTVHRVLVRAGVVEAAPAKRPRSSFRRFEYDRPNGCWQIDGTGWHLADRTWVCILRVGDDHSRMALATRAAAAETTTDAWACVETAIERHGRPVMLLSDGGAAFTQRRRGPKSGLSDFEARLRALGINPVVSSPFHPQTCGKKERDWQPLKRWLAAQPPPDLEELQRQLDAYDVLFNTDRPHQGIGRADPGRALRRHREGTPAPTAHSRTLRDQRTPRSRAAASSSAAATASPSAPPGPASPSPSSETASTSPSCTAPRSSCATTSTPPANTTQRTTPRPPRNASTVRNGPDTRVRDVPSHHSHLVTAIGHLVR